MSTSTVTPDIGNPFDRPLNSELQDHQQAQAATPPLDTGYVNPFDEPLASEKAEAQHAEATATNGPYVPNARIRNMTVDPTKDVHSAGEAFLSGAKTGVEAAAIPASAIGLGYGGPVLAAIGEHLDTIKKVVDYAEKIGLKGLEYEGARKLYKEFSGNSK